MGQRDKWNELYAAQRKALVDYAAPLLGSRDEAEDVVQEAYLNLSRTAETAGREDVPAKAYLYRIVRNLSFNKLKRTRRQRQQNPLNLPWWALPMGAGSPEDNAVLSDRVSRVATALSSMPERTRKIVQMHRFDGYTLEEIADHLGISVTTVHRLLGDAMEGVKDVLRRDME